MSKKLDVIVLLKRALLCAEFADEPLQGETAPQAFQTPMPYRDIVLNK